MKKIDNHKSSLLKLDQASLKNIFAIILYNEENAFLRKVLDDPDYWDSLNMKSGKLFTIFATRLKRGNYSDRKDTKNPNYMIPIWVEPEENIDLLHTLGITDSIKLPTFNVYANFRNEFHTCSYIIESESVEQTYKSLRDICDIICKTVDRIDESNHMNTEAILRELKGNLNYSQFWKKTFRGLEILRKLKSFAGI